MYKYYCLGFTAVILYLNGFLPILHKTAMYSNKGQGQQQPLERNNTIPAKYEKMVLIVIDALRLDFVNSQLTPQLWNSFHKKGCFMAVKAESPTVTMPRIKALTTGNLPQFVDIILNLAHISPLDDSFIHQAHKKGKRIVFYGDDTWLKLFPNIFKRYEGTTSFYVNDFEEVDNNVTRNVKLELENDDWDMMILHYLGLDHIGHVLGPRSPRIQEKLAEMDAIFHEIFTKVFRNSERSLILVTGDHGMKDSGGHGGSTFAETTVPLVIVGMNCSNDSFSQIDIPANLAVLFGHDIPDTSIGQLQSNLLKDLSLEEYLDALKYNTQLLRKKMDLCHNKYNAAVSFHNLFRTNRNEEIGMEARRLYEKCSRDISAKIISVTVRQETYSLFISIVTCLWLLIALTFLKYQSFINELEALAIFFLILYQLCNVEKGFSWAIALIIVVAFLKNVYTSFPSIVKLTLRPKDNLLLLVTLVYPMTFLSSSYIEEEHQFWYFFTSLYMISKVCSCFQKKNSKTAFHYILLLFCFRYLRILNRVGDQWASLPDLADWLKQEENCYYWYIHLFVSAMLSGISLTFMDDKSKLHSMMNMCILILIYIFKIRVQENTSLGKFIWFCILLKLIHITISKSNITSVFALMITLLLKPHNTILVPVFHFASHLSHGLQDFRTTVITHLWLGCTFFFLQGHCNSLASVDVSSGYIGLTEYRAPVVITQVLIHTYAFPLLSHLLLFKNLQIDRKESFSIFFLYRLFIIAVVFVVVFLQRHHLFIWSVFAPKLIVESSHFCVLFIEISCYYFLLLLNKKNSD